MRIQFIEPNDCWLKMLPLSYTRPVADLRVGILRIHEKWMKRLDANECAFDSQEYLSELFPNNTDSIDLKIHSSLLPSNELVSAFKALGKNEALEKDGILLGGKGNLSVRIEFSGTTTLVEYPWDIFRLTKQEIESDFDLITEGRQSQPINDKHTVIYGSRIFLEEGAEVKTAVLNAENGAIYLGRNSQVSEGALIRGAFALGEGSTVSMGAKMRGDSSIGPMCKVGGEISNSSIQGNSSKSHDGFLGNSVLGEWCNIGADSNNSNLKNNYANVKMWDFASERFKDTGLQFCGLIMADHSKCGINTMFNTGTTIGVSANIFGSGFPRTIIPSFAWGGASGFTTYQLKKVFETARLVLVRRNKELTSADEAMLTKIFELTASQRNWDK